MNHYRIVGLILITFFIAACGKPVGKSLLRSVSAGCTGFDCDTNSDSNGEADVLKISPDSSVMGSNIDDGDVVDIQGQCVDLNRKNNRILVEVFAGTDETVNPYISNDNNVDCLQTNNAVTSGTEPVTDLKISPNFVTLAPSMSYPLVASGGAGGFLFSKHSGLTAGTSVLGATLTITAPATPGLSVYKVSDGTNFAYTIIYTVTGTSPAAPSLSTNQCFWVTKGIGLVDTSSGTNRIYPQCHGGRFGFSLKVGKAQSYTARMKLRTFDGTVAESIWSSVRIDRALKTPIIRTVSYDSTNVTASIKSEASRFNFNILHSLTRTFTDTVQTSTVPASIFSNEITASTAPGSSLFDFKDSTVVEGVTYNYTLSRVDIATASPSLASFSSVVSSIVMPRPTIRFTSAPTSGTCYFALSSSRNAVASYVWARSRNSGWTGNNKDAPLATAGVIASCSGPGASVCMQAGLVATETYYFAVRAQSATPEIGKWSDEISCLVP